MAKAKKEEKVTKEVKTSTPTTTTAAAPDVVIDQPEAPSLGEFIDAPASYNTDELKPEVAEATKNINPDLVKKWEDTGFLTGLKGKDNSEITKLMESRPNQRLGPSLKEVMDKHNTGIFGASQISLLKMEILGSVEFQDVQDVIASKDYRYYDENGDPQNYGLYYLKATELSGTISIHSIIYDEAMKDIVIRAKIK